MERITSIRSNKQWFEGENRVFAYRCSTCEVERVELNFGTDGVEEILFNFLVHGDPDTWNQAPYKFDKTRFLEHTESHIKETFSALSVENLESLKAYPTLFAIENEGKPSRIGYIENLKIRSDHILIEYKFDPIFPPIDIGILKKLEKHLNITKFEMHRTHWAIKEINLFEILVEAGVLTSEQIDASRALREKKSLREKMSSSNLVAVQNNGPVGREGSKVVTTFDEYVLGKQLGQGGAGTVFYAKAADGESVAIKLLKKGLSSEKIKRFKNEIAFCQGNWHAGIIRVLDHGFSFENEEKRFFYVMPIYDSTYRDYISFDKDLSQCENSIIQILDAVEVAHSRGCFHRDIKPENILANKSFSQFVLSDFGIAHFEEEDLVTAVETKHASRLANFQYASPEQKTRDAKVDHRADIYALGLIINETFTRQVPHGTGFKKIADVSSAHSYLDKIVEKMIHQNPDRRFQKIEEIKAELVGRNKVITPMREEKPNQTHANEQVISDPVSIKTAVATLKGLLPDEKNEIQIDDFLNEEVERVFQSFKKNDPEAQNRIIDQIPIYEKETEVLRSMLMTGTRWGKPAFTQTWVRSIDRFGHPIRWYGALLMLYTVGLSCVSSKRFQLLAKILKETSYEDIRGSGPLCIKVFASEKSDRINHERGDNKRFYTPLSDHIFDLLKNDCLPVVGTEEKYKKAFNQYEYLSGLTHAYFVAERGGGLTARAWGPPGRFCWQVREHMGFGKIDFNKAILGDEIGEIAEQFVSVGLFNGKLDTFFEIAKEYNELQSEISNRWH